MVEEMVGMSEHELIQWLKNFADRLDSRAESKQQRLRVYTLEIPYEEIFLKNGHVKIKEYVARERIRAHNLNEARNKLYCRVLNACMEAKYRKDIISYKVHRDKIRTL